MPAYARKAVTPQALAAAYKQQRRPPVALWSRRMRKDIRRQIRKLRQHDRHDNGLEKGRKYRRWAVAEVFDKHRDARIKELL